MLLKVLTSKIPYLSTSQVHCGQRSYRLPHDVLTTCLHTELEESPTVKARPYTYLSKISHHCYHWWVSIDDSSGENSNVNKTPATVNVLVTVSPRPDLTRIR